MAALLLGALQGAQAMDVAGVKVDDEITVGSQRLVLNGAGIRYKYGFQIYVCALYLPQKRNQVKDILALPGQKRVVVTMLREMSNDDLGSALLSGIRKNSTPEETQRFGLQLVKMGELFASIPRLKKGDTFSLDYSANVGTVIGVNGVPVLEPLPDQQFYDSLLKIWMGENPADSSLKPKLLGLSEDSTRSNPR